MSDCLFVCLLACFLLVRFFARLFVCMSVCLFVSLLVCLFVCLFNCLFVCLFVCLIVCLFVCLFNCLLVCLFIFFASVCLLYVCVCRCITLLERISHVKPHRLFQVWPLLQQLPICLALPHGNPAKPWLDLFKCPLCSPCIQYSDLPKCLKMLFGQLAFLSRVLEVSTTPFWNPLFAWLWLASFARSWPKACHPCKGTKREQCTMHTWSWAHINPYSS